MYLKLKAVILLIVLSIFGGSIFAQPVINQTDAKNRKQGVWEKFHPETRKVAYRATFKDDVPVGKTQRYYEDGSLQAEVIHTGKGRDRAKLYYPTGVLMAQGVYINQERDSVWQMFDENGQLRNDETYRNGKKNGLARLYNSEGTVLEKVYYKDDFRHGDWEQYYDDGKLRLKCHVVDGLYYEGKYMEYYPDGKKRLEGTYVDGKKESSWYHYNDDGSIEIIYVYRNGKVEETFPKNGVFEDYYPNDILRSSYTWKDGKKSGPFKEYYMQGEWKLAETRDEFGEPLKVQRLSGTQIMREGKYLDGELHGEIITYNTEGKVSKRETYHRGVLAK
jgi:antitoxin component YwqK of YwqJK toxin-antitoxin module